MPSLVRRIGAVSLTLSLLAGAAAAQRAVPRYSAPQRRGPSNLTDRVQLSGWYGWQFGGGMHDVYLPRANEYVSFETPDAANVGGGIHFRTSQTTWTGIVWNVQPTSLDITDRAVQPDSTLFDMATHYVHLVVESEQRVGGRDARTKPFVTGGLGITIFDPESPQYGTETRFSLNAGVGVRSYIGERIGLRGQFRFWMTFVGSGGGGMWCGGGGCSVSVSGYGYFQGDVSGGAFIAF